MTVIQFQPTMGRQKPGKGPFRAPAQILVLPVTKRPHYKLDGLDRDVDRFVALATGIPLQPWQADILRKLRAGADQI